MKHKYVIFDRDGTLIEHIPYLLDVNAVEIKKGIKIGLMQLKKLNYNFGIITNQSVIARKPGNEEYVKAINEKIELICKRYGIRFDFIYYCPHLPESFCNCRKPNIALGRQAVKKFKIDKKLSFYVGDSLSDVEFAKKLNIRSVLITSKNTKIDLKLKDTVCVNNLVEFAKYVESSRL